MEIKFLPLYEGVSLYDALKAIENDFLEKEAKYTSATIGAVMSLETGGGGTLLVKLGGNITKKYTLRQHGSVFIVEVRNPKYKGAI